MAPRRVLGTGSSTGWQAAPSRVGGGDAARGSPCRGQRADSGGGIRRPGPSDVERRNPDQRLARPGTPGSGNCRVGSSRGERSARKSASASCVRREIAIPKSPAGMVLRPDQVEFEAVDKRPLLHFALSPFLMPVRVTGRFAVNSGSWGGGALRPQRAARRFPRPCPAVCRRNRNWRYGLAARPRSASAGPRRRWSVRPWPRSAASRVRAGPSPR